jgi:hypothetical protein
LDPWITRAIAYFCPEDEATHALMRLESNRYFQATRSVEDYVDEFEDLIDLSGYTDPLVTVVKFSRGLSTAIQDKIAESGKDRPADDDFRGWYESAKRFDRNLLANEAFRSSTSPAMPLALEGMVQKAEWLEIPIGSKRFSAVHRVDKTPLPNQ